MTKPKRLPLVLGALLGSLLAVPGAAVADERVCAGAIGSETVGNIRVPADAACTLTGTLVQGTVKIERGAALEAQGVRVIGNVQARAPPTSR